MGIPKIPRHNAVPDLLTTSPHLKCSTSIISHNTTAANRDIIKEYSGFNKCGTYNFINELKL